ncbi:hypothetical protein M9Y10_015460 [Tritrichomonas musculus]|uniref:Protein kinase domain-containing protein n=1 Tax=Tritrichomonas musculus TaxID=1915356 RepID=A0ABR2L2C4_9EUKA
MMLRTETDDGYMISIPYSFHGYSYVDILGTGCTSVVFLFQEHISGQLFSAKIIPKKYIEKKNLYKQINTEITVLREVDHPNIVKFHDCFEYTNVNNDSYVVIVTEYCENGDLFSYTNEYGFKDELQKKKIIKQFLEAVKYLHKKGIAHGDLKPENILLDSDLNAKLADFGFTKTNEIAGDEAKSGTLYYAAPELFVRGEYNTLKADIWSIGITLYCLTQSSFPFRKGNKREIVDQIASQKIRLAKSTPIALRKVVEKCATKAEDRPSIDELMEDEYFHLIEKQSNCL